MVCYQVTCANIAAYDELAYEKACTRTKGRFPNWLNYYQVKVPIDVKDGVLCIAVQDDFVKIYGKNTIPDDFDITKLEYWTETAQHKKFYLYDNREIWTNLTVARKKLGLSTDVLVHADEYTVLCKCIDCGDNYVVDSSEYISHISTGKPFPDFCLCCRDRLR